MSTEAAKGSGLAVVHEMGEAALADDSTAVMALASRWYLGVRRREPRRGAGMGRLTGVRAGASAWGRGRGAVAGSENGGTDGTL